MWKCINYHNESDVFIHGKLRRTISCHQFASAEFKIWTQRIRYVSNGTRGSFPGVKAARA